MSDKKRLAEKAKKLIEEDGLHNLTREKLCNAVGISPGSFTYRSGLRFNEFLLTIKQESPMLQRCNKKRVHPEIRKRQILDVAIFLSKKNPKFTRSEVSKMCGISTALVHKLFGSMKNLKSCVEKKENEIC